MLARLFNLLISTAVGYAALRLCVTGRWLIWAYLLLPTSLNLSASCSQDALILALSALAGVLLARATAGCRMMTAPELLASAATLLLIIGARVPYLPLAFLLFLPEVNLRRFDRRSWQPAAGCVLVIFVFAAAWQGLVHPFGTLSQPLANPARQVAFLGAQPVLGSYKITAGMLRAAPGLAVKGMEVLGTNDVFPPLFIYILLALSLGAIVCLAPMEGASNVASRALLIALLMIVIVGICLAEYIFWSPPLSDSIEGLQSRYFLPLLPLGLFMLRRSRAASQIGAWRKRSIVVASVMFSMAVLYVPSIVAQRVYGLSEMQALAAAMR